MNRSESRSAGPVSTASSELATAAGGRVLRLCTRSMSTANLIDAFDNADGRGKDYLPSRGA